MNVDFKKWIICSAIGEVLGILLSIKLSNAWYLLMGPLYVVGFAYGAGKFYPWFLSAIGAIGKASFLAFLASKPLLGILALAFMCVCGGVIVAIGWLVGLVMAVIALIRAIVEAVQEGGCGRTPFIPRPSKTWEQIGPKQPEDFNHDDVLDDYRPGQLGDGSGDGLADDFWNAEENSLDSSSFGLPNLPEDAVFPEESIFGEDGDSFWG